VHVIISLGAIGSGLVVLAGLLMGRRLDVWTGVFLAGTVATSVTGFFFPFHQFTPALGVGIISLALLAVAIFGRYARRLAGRWRGIYVVSALVALYLNVFVLIVQSFQRVPTLKAMAPTQSEAPFIILQAFALVLFVILTIFAVIRFRIETVP
jgi:hypothetical protein